MQRMMSRTPRLPRFALSIALVAATGLGGLTAVASAPVVYAAALSTEIDVHVGAIAPAAMALAPAATAIIPTSPSRSTIGGWILTWLNADRAARGLRPLRLDTRIRSVADARSEKLATLGVLVHSAAGDLGAQLKTAGVQWFAWGEDIGTTTYPWGRVAARQLYLAWRKSPPHRALLMSASLNYIGIGLGYRASARATYAAIDFTESGDHTAPIARMTSASRTGTTIAFTWRGADVALQTHTSGVRSFDVEYRCGDGSWQVIRQGTKATSIRLAGRSHGHRYFVRVRARDNAGNVSGWSAALHVRVP
jgi:uncharacterized protein YkwD